jgi:signal transduction histidine kinase
LLATTLRLLEAKATRARVHPRPVLTRNRVLTAFQLAVVLPTIGAIAFLVSSDPSVLRLELLVWVAVVAVVVLLPVPFEGGMPFSVDFPVLLALGFVYEPGTAALTALIGSMDRRELRGEVGVMRAIFNRSQVALSVLAASSAFHALAGIRSGWLVLLPAALAAAIVDNLVNFSLVSAAVSLSSGKGLVATLKTMRVGQRKEFLINYVGLSFVGTVLARLYMQPSFRFWALPAVLVPLMFARQMFFKGRALEEAHHQLQEREKVLEALSNRMAEERQDERSQIAAYLHDDLAQLLFRLSLQVDIAKRHLRSGDPDETEKGLEAIRETKNRTSDMIRALIRDLHRSPLGRKGLAEAMTSFTEDVGQGSGIAFKVSVADLPLSPPIQLLIYHISREAVMNSLKHSGASTISITLEAGEHDVRLTIGDDGVGFDASAPDPEGHFGLSMMRERAQVAGGTYELQSSPGEGTTITATFPISWLEEQKSSEEEQASATSGPEPRAEDGTREELPALA